MPRHVRKFVHNGKQVVEVTPDGEQAICAEISADAARFREELRGELPQGKGKRRSIAKWPIYSDAMGVGVDQIEEARAIARKHGVNTEYLPDGRPILRDASHRRRHAEVFGFYDRNAGPSDPTPKHYRASDFE